MIALILSIISLGVVLIFIRRFRSGASSGAKRFLIYYLGFYPDKTLSKPLAAFLAIDDLQRRLIIRDCQIPFGSLVSVQIMTQRSLQEEMVVSLGLFAKAFKQHSSFLLITYHKEKLVSEYILLQSNQAVMIRRLLIRRMRSVTDEIEEEIHQ